MTNSPDSPELALPDGHPLAGTLYEELRALAAYHLKGEREGHSLQPTEIVHEAFVRLQPLLEQVKYERTHLVALVSRTMRRVLVDHARTRGAAKRPSSAVRVTLSEATRVSERSFEDVLDLNLVLERFATRDPRAAHVAEMMLFSGFTQEEVAEHLGVSLRTVTGDYAIARAWMKRELAGDDRRG